MRLPAKNPDWEKYLERGANIYLVPEDREELSHQPVPVGDMSCWTALWNAGYRSDEDLRAASDKDLLAVKGVGQKTVIKIREALQFHS